MEKNLSDCVVWLIDFLSRGAKPRRIVSGEAIKNNILFEKDDINNVNKGFIHISQHDFYMRKMIYEFS